MHGKLWLVAAGLGLLTVRLYADTTWVSGEVLGTWTAAQSPVIVVGPITVPFGQTLQIGPGVTVFFEERNGLTVERAALLLAVGEEGDSIRFTTDTIRFPNRWAGIALEDSADTCRFEYCVLEKAEGNLVGGGLRAGWTNLEIRHSAVRDNRAGPPDSSSEGGGISLSHGTGRLTDCVFERNTASKGGAAAITSGSNGVFTDCRIAGNHADSLGGGIWCWSYGDYRTLKFNRCNFVGNSATRGGALYVALNVRTMMRDCSLSLNTAHHGGAIWLQTQSFDTIQGCTMLSNWARACGGAVYLTQDHNRLAWFSHCILARNSASLGGGFYAEPWGNPAIHHCTLVLNSAAEHGAGAYLSFGSDWSALTNTIIGFCPQGEALAFAPASGIHVLSHCAFYGDRTRLFLNESVRLTQVNAQGDSCDADGNVLFDPAFADTAADNYNLTARSHCIDAGGASAAFPPDPDSTAPDIGAFYFEQRHMPLDRFDLVSPPDDEWIHSPGNVRFLWRRAFDPDYHDSTTYTLHATASGTAYVFEARRDTFCLVNVSGMGIPNQTWVQWYVDAHGNYPRETARSRSVFRFWFDISGSAAEQVAGLPTELALHPCFPNPFNVQTRIRFDLPRASEVKLEIFDVLGRRSAVLVNGRKDAGYHQVSLDGSSLSTGVYFCRLQAGETRRTTKMLLLK
jgi:hypothetical protein